MFGPDGTQAPPPPRVYPDPLAGLVAAERYLARPALPIVVAAAPVPTAEEVRRAVAAQMAREEQVNRPRQRRQPAPPRPHQVPRPPADAQVQQPQQAVAKTFDTGNALLGCGCVLVLVVAFVMIVVALFG